MKKASRKIIQEAIKDSLNEGPLDAIKSSVAGAKGAASGAKGLARTAKANYHINNIASQMDQFANKAEKAWVMHKKKADKQAQKLSKSKNPTIAQTGDQMERYLDQAEDELGGIVRKIQKSLVRSSMNFGDQKGQQNQNPLTNPQKQQQMPPQQLSQAPKDFDQWLRSQGVSPRAMDRRGYAKMADEFIKKQRQVRSKMYTPPPLAQKEAPPSPKVLEPEEIGAKMEPEPPKPPDMTPDQIQKLINKKKAQSPQQDKKPLKRLSEPSSEQPKLSSIKGLDQPLIGGKPRPKISPDPVVSPKGSSIPDVTPKPQIKPQQTKKVGEPEAEPFPLVTKKEPKSREDKILQSLKGKGKEKDGLYSIKDLMSALDKNPAYKNASPEKKAKIRTAVQQKRKGKSFKSKKKLSPQEKSALRRKANKIISKHEIK